MRTLAFIAVVLAGCATQPVSDRDMQPPRENRVYAPEHLVESAGTLPIVVKRDKEFRIMGCVIRIYLDGTAIADLGSSDGVVIHAQPGTRMLGAELCPNTAGGGISELVVDLSPGKIARFRVNSGAGGDVLELHPTAF